jgi:hypothetical protein
MIWAASAATETDACQDMSIEKQSIKINAKGGKREGEEGRG